jgi:hypothetical protein
VRGARTHTERGERCCTILSCADTISGIRNTTCFRKHPRDLYVPERHGSGQAVRGAARRRGRRGRRGALARLGPVFSPCSPPRAPVRLAPSRAPTVRESRPRLLRSRASRFLHTPGGGGAGQRWRWKTAPLASPIRHMLPRRRPPSRCVGASSLDDVAVRACIKDGSRGALRGALRRLRARSPAPCLALGSCRRGGCCTTTFLCPARPDRATARSETAAGARPLHGRVFASLCAHARMCSLPIAPPCPHAHGCACRTRVHKLVQV